MDSVINTSPPTSPRPNDVWVDERGRNFVWTLNSDGHGQWVQVIASTSSVRLLNSPPLSPRPDDVWVDEHGRHFVWLLNADGYGQWVQVPTAPRPPTVMPFAPPITNATPKCTSATTPPLNPLPNDLWFDTTTGFFFIFYNDGNTYQWVVTNPGRGSDVVPPSSVAPVFLTADPGITLVPDPFIGIGSVGIDTVWFDARVASEIPANLPPSGLAGGDLAGSYPNPTVKASVALGGNPTATTQATSDSSQRLATTAFVKTNIAALPAPPTTLPPSGVAGGDLTGTYPNPTLVGGPLSNYELLSHKGAASGYAPLDATTKVPAAYLPAYVDDVLEFASFAAFPATGSTGVIYVALDTNKVYRWSGSAYVEISPSPGSTDAVPEGSTNLYFTNERVDDRTAALIVAGTNITSTYNDVANTLTIAAAAYPTALPPSGTASGDLAGTYPSPTIKADVALTGNPTAPTPTAGDNDTSIATTAFVQAALGAVSVTIPAGTVAFGGAGGVLTGNSTLAWDNTNKAFAITGYTGSGSAFFTSGSVPASPASDVFRMDVTNPSNNTGNIFRLRSGPTSGGLVDAFKVDMAGDASMSGSCQVLNSSGLVAGGAIYFGYMIGNFTGGTLALWGGSGAPTFNSGGKFGGLYLNGASPGLPYYNSNGAAGWDRLVGETSSQLLLNKIFPVGSIQPSSTNGQVLTTVAGVAAWAAASGGATITVSDTAPGSPTAGALWWNSVLGALFLYYNDGNTSQWVPASPAPQAVVLVPKVTKFLATGTFTPDPLMVHGFAVGKGGGGAGGAYTGTAGVLQGAGGGNSGNKATSYFKVGQLTPTVAVTIGAGGVPVVGGVGGTGGSTIFGSLLTATGGAGGGQFGSSTVSTTGCIGDDIEPGFPGGQGTQLQATGLSGTVAGGNGGGPGGGLGAVVGSSAAAGGNGLPNSGGGAGGTASNMAAGAFGAATGGTGYLTVVEYVRA